MTVALPAGVLWVRGPGVDGLEEGLCYCGLGAFCESGLLGAHAPGELVAKVGYFGVKSAKVCRAQMGDQTC